MSLADELLADLEEAGLDGEDVTVDQNDDGDVDDIGDIDDLDAAMDTGQSGIDSNSIRNVARYPTLLLFFFVFHVLFQFLLWEIFSLTSTVGNHWYVLEINVTNTYESAKKEITKNFKC